MLSGLPASGKSTWAKQYCKDNSNFIRLNKDDIREELGNQGFSREFENKVLQIQRGRGLQYLEDGFSIIIDDTNFAEKHRTYWEGVANNSKNQIEFEFKYFDVPVDTCVDRDKHREKSIGEGVIRDMYKNYVKHKLTKTDARYIAQQDKKLPKCIICDIDGTLALINGRSPYDDSKIHTDKPNTHVINIVNDYFEARFDTFRGQNSKVILMSGRMDKCREQTEKWLKDNHVNYDFLYMRKTDDFRQDSIVKKELFDQYIKDKYFVEYWLDDRDQVVKMVREELGLLCLQVYYGNF